MDKYRLTEAQNGIFAMLLKQRRQIDMQIGEFVKMLCKMAGVDNSWRVVGNPGSGFSLVRPVEQKTEEEEGD